MLLRAATLAARVAADARARRRSGAPGWDELLSTVAGPWQLDIAAQVEPAVAASEEDPVADVDEVARPECAAGVLFVDDEGSVLLVEPTYKAMWEIPGGRTEIGETPREAAARQLFEEFQIEVPLGRLLVVDWAPHVREERVRFVFDGGSLTDEQLDAIELKPDEITTWAFIEPAELFVMMEPRLVRRVTAALEARAAGATLYLENGVPVDHAG